MEPESVPQFRAAKRRKVFRTKPHDSDVEDQQPTRPGASNEGSQASDDDEADEPTITITSHVRRPAARKFGYGTSVLATSSTQSRVENERSMVLATTSSAVDLVAKRFAPQTGLVVDDTEKHMNAYVESRLAQLQGDSVDQDDSFTNSKTPELDTGLNKPGLRQAAGLGKLQEIDLGPDAARLNYLRTQQAAAKINGQQQAEPEPEQKGKDKDKRKLKPRYGRNGRPIKGKRRMVRRTSEDIKREQMVEAILAESRIDLYEPENPSANTLVDEDVDVDDRVAEEFKRNYLDNQQARRRNPQPISQSRSKDEADKKMKGPKLGGSRSARAAMYKAMQEKEGQK